jgi:adenylate cyclase
MNKVLIILLLALLSASSQAQVNADSLWTVWYDETQPDTNRLKAMDDLTHKYFLRTLNHLDSMFFYSQKMLDLATEKGLKKYQANALHNIALSLYHSGRLDEGLELNSQSLALREEIGDKKGAGRSLANIGLIYRVKQNYFTGLDHYKRALVYFEDVGDYGLISHALNSIGGVYGQMGNNPKAIDYMSRALAVIEASGNESFLTNSLLNLAAMYDKVNDLDKSREYLTRAYETAKSTAHKQSEISALHGLGILKVATGNYDEALAYSESLFSMSKKTESSGYNVVLNYAYDLKAKTYLAMRDYDNALKFFELSNKLGESIGGYSSALSHALQLGTIYKLKKDGKNAVKWCNEALILAQNENSLESQAHSCECLYESYKMLNNGNKALEYHERFLVLNDSLNKEEAGKKLQQMEFAKQVFADSIAQLETDRLVEEAHQEEVRQGEKTRNIAIGGGLFFLLAAGGFYSRWRYVRKSKAIIESERDRSDNLLLNILPADIAAELKANGKAEARDFDTVSILFTDFKGFTQASEKLSAQELVAEINSCFEAFDGIMGKYNIEKIKTIGDAYMAAGGLPVPANDSVKNTVLAALEMQAFISDRKATNDAANQPAFEMRVGIHTGPVVAGIVGVKKFQYDIWGDTVNTASRMESNGEVGKVNISQSTYELIKTEVSLPAEGRFEFESRGKIEAKGKGEIEMYFVALPS